MRRDGTRVRLSPGGPRVRLADIAAFELGRGYRVVPVERPGGATVTAARVGRQPTNPRPGPSLRVELTQRGARLDSVLAVRIVPTTAGDH
jgi:hypothetical protein